MTRIRIAIVDDHPVVCAGIRGLLESQAEFEVVGTAEAAAEAVDLLARTRPDVVLLDLQLRKGTGFDVMEGVRSRELEVKVLVLTTYDTDEDIKASMRLGATGYLLKDAGPAQLFAAIRRAATGERVLAPALESRLEARRPAEFGRLSEREIEVLRCVSEGMSNRRVAQSLFISEATVKTHLAHLYDKLGVKDRAAAVAEAARLGILRLR